MIYHIAATFQMQTCSQGDAVGAKAPPSSGADPGFHKGGCLDGNTESV